MNRVSLKLILLALVATSVHAQVWADQGSGSLLSAVAPQNCTNTISPPYCVGVSFDYGDNFFQILKAWGSCIARTKAGSEQLACFGGGHVATLDNSIYTVNLYANPVSVSALGVPSIPYGSNSPVTGVNATMQQPNADGTPLSQHSYQNSVYLPTHDEMFFWAQGASNYRAIRGSPNQDRLTFTYKFSDNTWHNMAPGGFNVTPSGPIPNDSSSAAYCALDTTGVSAHDRVYCIWGQGGGPQAFVLYDRDDNTWAQLRGLGGLPYTFGGNSAAIDPVRKLIVSFGPLNDNGTGGFQVVKIDISGSPWTATDITSSLSGCSALNAVTHPGMQYYPMTADFVIYPGSGNTVYHFNPATAVCTSQTVSGGPTASPSASGQWGKFNFFPTLNKFANTTSTSTNAFTLDLGTPPVITNPASAGPITAGTQNTAYSFTFAATGTTPLVWSITSGAPPTGVSLNSSTGVLAGTPTASGTFNFTISVTNGFGSPSTQADSLTIAPVCLITAPTLPSGKFNVPYSQTVTTAGCTSPTFAITSGSIPTGMTLHTGTGVIDGTPTVPGLFNFTIGVTDAAGSPSQVYNPGITIIPGPGVLNVLTVPGFISR